LEIGPILLIQLLHLPEKIGPIWLGSYALAKEMRVQQKLSKTTTRWLLVGLMLLGFGCGCCAWVTRASGGMRGWQPGQPVNRWPTLPAGRPPMCIPHSTFGCSTIGG
jgi:hypothetical protein